MSLLDSIEIGLDLPEPLVVGYGLLLGVIFFLGFLLVTGFSSGQLPKTLQALLMRFSPQDIRGIYQQLFVPHRQWLGITLTLALVDLLLLSSAEPQWLGVIEIPIGLMVGLSIVLLGFKLFEVFFDNYLLDIALEDKTKVNSELLVLGQFLSKAAIILVVILIFAQSHQVNLIGLVASLGVAGAAVAFGSQKIIEQILWSVVLYIDRPFNVDEYIHLPDRTMGRVESVGWRSTKIRLSGKNTLVIVPNSNLAQVSIENLTRANRVVSVVNITFFRAMLDEEKALIHQLILASTADILGIDHRLTQVSLQDIVHDHHREAVQAQIIFFILGTTDISMELRKGLLEIARENIIKQLHEYGINFSFEEELFDVSQPMNI